MTEAAKIKLIRSALNISQRELSRQINISQPVISNIESGKLGVSKNILTKLQKKYKLNLDWFHNERGEMFGKPGINISGIKGSDKDEIIRLLKEQNFLLKKQIEDKDIIIQLLTDKSRTNPPKKAIKNLP